MRYRKIEGSIFNPHKILKSDLTSLSTQMAILLLKFHRMQITTDLKNNLTITDYSKEKLQQTWDTASEWLKKHLTEKEYEIAEKWWKKTILFFATRSQEPVLVHGDPWYENIILDDKLNIKAIVDFDKVALGDLAIDFVVQQYVSKEFMNNVIHEYKSLGGKLGKNFEKRVKLLTGIKSIEDLNYCLYINYIYPDTLEEIKREIAEDTTY